jgi:hypothetical protein
MLGEHHSHHAGEALGGPIPKVHFSLCIVQSVKQLPGGITEIKVRFVSGGMADEVPATGGRLDSDRERQLDVG